MEQIKDILPSFCIASVMAIVVYCISLINISPFILLPVQLITGFVIVIGLSEIGHRYEYLQVKEITISIINKIKHGRK
jgi:hypothetical protein